MSAPQRAADVAAGVSVAAASGSWIAETNEVLQLIGSLIAIFAGVGALVVHYFNVREKLKK